METRDAIRSVVENIPGICQLKPEQEECLVHILNGGDVVALLTTGFGKSLIYQLLPIVSKKLRESRSLLSVELELAPFWQVSVSFLFQSLNIAMSWCKLAIKLQHFRQTRNERRAVFNRTNPNFDSWLQIFSCLSLLSNISLDALIVPWMHRFISHNLQKSFTAIFTTVFHSMVLFSPHTCVYSGSSRRLSRLTGTPMILNFRQAPPPQESKRLSSMPFQTLSTKQSEVAEFGITRLTKGWKSKKCWKDSAGRKTSN